MDLHKATGKMVLCLEKGLKLQQSNSGNQQWCISWFLQEKILVDSCAACCRIDKVACLFFQTNTGHCQRHGIIPDQLVYNSDLE